MNLAPSSRLQDSGNQGFVALCPPLPREKDLKLVQYVVCVNSSLSVSTTSQVCYPGFQGESRS